MKRRITVGLLARLVVGPVWIGLLIATLVFGDSDRTRRLVLGGLCAAAALMWVGLYVHSLLTAWPRDHPEYDEEVP